MAVDVQALQATPRDDERAAEFIELCRLRLGGEWRLVRSSSKMSKTIFEAEYNGRLVVGKASASKRAQTAFGKSKTLREAGLRPPCEYTAAEPIAWFEDCKLLLLEKAPGLSVAECMKQDNDCRPYVRQAAQWLEHLQSLQVDLAPAFFDVAAAKTRAEELAAGVKDPDTANAAAAAIDVLQGKPARVVSSHGDYHPMNIFVAPGRVTAIDLDTVGSREPEADVGYFLGQLANFGLMMFGSFQKTRELRDVFSAVFPDLDKRRISAYIAWALLQSLHYDACILKVKNDKAGLMVQAARAALYTGSPDAAEG